MRKPTTVSIETDLLNKAKAFAITEGRSLSNQVEQWIDEKLHPKENPKK